MGTEPNHSVTEADTCRRQKRADYLLRCRPDFNIAVVEAKADYKRPGAALMPSILSKAFGREL